MNQHLDDDDSGQRTTGKAQTSCVAWFKLAELITRREKEKALSLHRLLAHSFDNKAYALQIEGDILWSLEDCLALEKYQQAAFLYKKEQKMVNAIAIYEHLLILQPKNVDFLSTLMFLYLLYDWQEKFQQRFKLLLSFLDNKIIDKDRFFGVTKKIIDFISDDKIAKQDWIEDGFGVQFDETQKKIILKSLLSILKTKKRSGLKNEIEQYCLEKNLQFGS